MRLQFSQFIRWLDIQGTESIFSQPISWSQWTCMKTQCLSILDENYYQIKFHILLDSIHPTPGKFENAAIFLRFGLPSTLIRHENGAFWKRSSNRRNLKTPAFVFVWTENVLKMELLDDDLVLVTIIMWFPDRVLLKRKSKMTGDCCVFKFLQWSVHEALDFLDILVTSSPVNWVKRCSSFITFMC